MKHFRSIKVAQSRVQPGLPHAYLPNFAEEWQKQMKPWQEFWESIPSEYQDKARQDWQQYQTEKAKANPGSFGNRAPSTTEQPAVPGAAGGQGEFAFGDPATSTAPDTVGVSGSKAERINQLEQQYHKTWNFFADSVLPKLGDNVQQANALQALFNEVRPVWKSLRAGIAQNPQLAESLNDTYIEQAMATLGHADTALQRLVQSDTLLDNQIGDFQVQLTRAFNAIKQLSFDNAAVDQGTAPAAQPATAQPATAQPAAQPAPQREPLYNRLPQAQPQPQNWLQKLNPRNWGQPA